MVIVYQGLEGIAKSKTRESNVKLYKKSRMNNKKTAVQRMKLNLCV